MNDRPFSRRDLLRLGLTAGAASLAGACGWQGGPLQPLLRGVSRLNDAVGEGLTSYGLAPQYPVSARSKDKDFPGYSRSHPVPPPAPDWALEVGGLVAKPMRLSLEMLKALPRVTYTVKHHCVEGWSAIGTWTGAPLSSVAALVEPAAAAKFLRFDTFDAGYFNGWDMKTALHPQTILAYSFNDGPLGPEHGAPLRVYSPLKLGYKLTKYLTALTFTAERPGGYWEDLGYPWLGGV